MARGPATNPRRDRQPGMTETRTELALHDVETREEVVAVARVLCSAASFAHALGHHQLRDRLVERASSVLEVEGS